MERPGVGGYRLEHMLGRGGTSVVYRAHDEALDRNVAVKLLSPELAEDRSFRERFLRESKLAASIEHPHIIPVYDAGESDGVLFIAMRYVEGTDLKALLRREHALDPHRALEIVAQVADALDTAHARGLIHRDVKPSNVLVAPGDHVYLADFGLTKSASDRSALTATGQLVGTVDYVAPEQIEGKPVDGRADLYALGCVFFECLTGEVPYPRDAELAVLWAHVQQDPPRVSERKPELPEALDEVVAKALAKDPAKRYSTASELVAAAGAVLRMPARRRRIRPRLAAGALLVIAGAVSAAAVLLTRSSPVVPLAKGDGVARIDPGSDRLTAAIPAGRGLVDIATGFGRVWVVNAETLSVETIDPRRGEIVRQTGLAGPGEFVTPLAIETDEHEVWVTEATARVAGVRYGAGPYATALTLGSGIAIDVATGDDSVWVATSLDQRIWRIDPLSWGHVETSVALAVRPSALVFADGALWVASTDNALVKIDPRRNSVAATVPLSFTPGGITFALGRIWLSNPAANTVVTVSARNLREPPTAIRVGVNPSGVAFGFGSVWVANSGDGTVSRIDPAGGRAVATVKVGPRPDRIAAGAGGVWAVTHGR